MNFALFPEMKARSDPDALALVDARLRLSWAELDRLANRFANLLQARGARRGDRLATYLPNRAELVIAFLGALKAGVIAVPLNWRLQGPDLARVLQHCAPALVVTAEDKVAAVDVAGASVLGTGNAPRSGSFWSALEGCSDAFATIGCQSGDIANLLYTSGTTATPKAAIHTHGMRVAVAAAMADCFKLSARDRGLAISPMFHTSGMSVFSNAMFAGCTLVLLERWDLDEFLDALERERITFMHLITTIVVDITRAPEEKFTRNTRSMRFTWGGGHAVDPKIFETFERRVGGVFLQGYSRTEGGLAYNPLDAARRRFDANGYGNRNSSDIAVMDPASGQLCAPGVVGEIVVRGDGVSPGYWDGDMVRARKPYDGGWQPTGDLGEIDGQGSLHFLGRDDHMIKTGGENVYPAEVAAVLLAMPAVADAVVLGLPDDRLGHRVAALVVAADPALTRDGVERACRSALAGFKIPRTVAFAAALPRLGNDKIDLAACRELLLAAA
jgi:acyl-CoA synthetase (AMP-forming)/AMP-acid ligase II